MRKITRRLELVLFAYHWNCINSLRQQATTLIEEGTVCSDVRLVTLSNRILQHGIKVSCIWRSRRGKLLNDSLNQVSV